MMYFVLITHETVIFCSVLEPIFKVFYLHLIYTVEKEDSL